MGDFAESVKKFAAVARKRADFVFIQSIEDTIDFMQKPVGEGGNMPVDTGFLRSSLRVTIGTPAIGSLALPADAKPGQYSPNDYSVTISNAKLGKTVFATYLANYAIFQEYGTQGREGRRFVGLARLEWGKIVSMNVKLAQKIKG